MAIINQRYKTVITDDLSTDPQVTQEVNYTNSNYDNHITKTITASSSGDGAISSNTPVSIINESSDARYVIINSTKKVHLYLNSATSPTVTGTNQDLSATFMVLDGNINEVWAVNTDTDGNSAYIKVVYVY